MREIQTVRCDNNVVKDHSTRPHPGPFLFMSMGVGATAIMVALCFVVLGLVALPIAKFFLLAAILLGIGIAVIFRIIAKKPLLPERFFRN